jgi:pimeloyl-ACP methyl ester carboxylesterase
MRIIGIVGIWDFPPRPHIDMWNYLRLAFKEKFPDATFEVEHLWYQPWEGKKIRGFADHLVDKHDTGEELILLGHSMGGVIATSIAPRFKRSRVRVVVTVFAPHKFLFGLFSSILSNTERVGSIPVLSFGARFDYLVWWGAKYPAAEKYIKMSSDHLFCLLFSKKPAREIAEETSLLFTP